MRKIGSRAHPYVLVVSHRIWGCGHGQVWPPPWRMHTSACVATLRWEDPTVVRAFKTLAAARRECRAVTAAWHDLTSPLPQVLAWHVVDIRSGEIYDRQPSPKGAPTHGEQDQHTGHLF